MKYLTPIPKQFVNQSGIPYSGGTVSVYLSGSDELADIFEDAEGDALCPNPCTLDSNGAWQCFVTADVPLDYIVKDAEGNVVASYFGIVVSGGGTGDVTKAYVDAQDRALGTRIGNLDQDLADEANRAEAAEKAAKTEVVGGENITIEETIAPDGHSIFEVSSAGAPQEQANWNQQDPSEPDYIKNKPTKLSEFTDDITKQSLVESGVGIEKPVSSAAVNAGLSEKADKVQVATAGNLAALEANGNLTDSGKKAADFATDSQGDKADSAVQGVKVNGTELSKDGNNVVDVPVPTASTATPLKDGTASAGSSSQWARGDHRHPTDDSREAVANKVQSIDDSSTTEYPSSKAVADFVNSSVATNTATFLGNFSLADIGLTYPATEVQIASALNSHTWPTGYPTNNDYVYVEIRNPQSTIDDKVQRYKYRDGLASWGYEYTLNNSSFTAEEKAAIDSGITSQDVTNLRADHTTLGSHVANTNNPHGVTAAQIGAEPAFSVLPISKGGTGKTTGKAATNNLFSDINNVNTDPDDTARIVFKYGSPSDSNGIFFARAITSLWNYIKGKISSVLGLSENGYTGNAATATTATSSTTASNYASGGGIDTALQGKSSTSHTHSVKINGTTKTIAATGDTAVDLGTYLTSHQSVSDNNPTLSWGATSTVGTVGSTNLQVTMPSNPASGKLDTNGDGSNVTAAFTAANTRANISTGEKLSAIFGKIAKWFADLKSVAWSGSYDDLTNKPSLATVATSGSYSDLSNKPTIPTVDQSYNATSTNPQSGTAVAQAVAKTVKKADASIIANGLSGERWYKVAESSFTGSYNNISAVIEINYTDSDIIYETPRKSNISTMLVGLNIRSQIADEPYAVLVTGICSKIVTGLDVCVVSRGAIAQRKIELWVKCGGDTYRSSALISQRAFGTFLLSDTSSFTFTSYDGVVGQAKPVSDSANNVYVYSPELVSFDSTKDASWINSGTFDAARIPTSLPNVTAGYANELSRYTLNAAGTYCIGQLTSATPFRYAGVTMLISTRDVYDDNAVYLVYLQRGSYGSDTTADVIGRAVLLTGRTTKRSSEIQFFHDWRSNMYTDFFVKIASSSEIVSIEILNNVGNCFSVSNTWNVPTSMPVGSIEFTYDTLVRSNNYGTSGQYLKSNGSGNAPSWENITTLSPTAAVANFDSFNGTVNTTNVVNSNAGSASTNPPKSDSRTFHVITTVGSNANYQTQLAIGIDSDRHAGLFYRCREGGTWNAWMQVLNERPASMATGSEYKGTHIDSNGHPVACSYGLSIGTAVADSSILTVL